MNKIISTLGIGCLCVVAGLVETFAQENVPDQIVFKDKIWDFKDINEKGGPQSHEFEFTNTSKIPIVISGVRASCGCTTPSWSKEPIMPGKTGTVTATYNPLGRPGPFNKTITVSSNATPSQVLLTIKGNVISQRTPEEIYPVSVGKVRLKMDRVAFGNVAKGKPRSIMIEVYNPTSSQVKVKFVAADPKLAALIASVEVPIASKGTANCAVVLSVDDYKEWGMLDPKLNIVVDGVTEINAPITSTANVIDAIDKANAAVAEFSTSFLDMGTVTVNSTTTKELVITNKGTTDLVIRNIQSSDPALTFKASTMTVKPNATSTLKITLKPTVKERLNKTIIITMADNKMPVKPIRITGEVK